MNADTDQPIMPLTDGATMNPATLPTRNLNILADTAPATVGSVRFTYDGNPDYETENVSPYALAGDTNGDYYAWTPSSGSHRLTATPYTGSNKSSTQGTSRTIAFTVT
jgi:hypothetical protein